MFQFIRAIEFRTGVEQSCCWECLEDRTQRNPPIFFLFWVENSYVFPIFWPLSFLFSYFLIVICHLTPWDRSFQLVSVWGLTFASSLATVIGEILCTFLKHSNHPFEATKPSTCSFSAIIKASSWSILPKTGMLEDLQRQYHFQTASLRSAYFPDLCHFNPFLWLFSYPSRISCFFFMMV